MLKIDNYQCIICDKIFEEPIELPCGFVCCRKHLVPCTNYENLNDISVLCFSCYQFHNFSSLSRSKIFEFVFDRNLDSNTEKFLIDLLKNLRELKYKLNLEFKIKTLDFNSSEKLIYNKNEQILFDLNQKLNKKFKNYILDMNKIKNYSHYLIKTFQQEKREICEKIKNREIFDPHLIKEFDDLITYFDYNPKTINKNNYKEFIRKYNKLDTVSSAIMETNFNKLDYNFRNFSFEINNEKNQQVCFLNESFKTDEVN